ncbi:hypothetical protein Tco_1506112 [Tanacetum coccineum]
MGLWYPKDTGFELAAFSDSDHAGCLDSRKSTSGGIQFLGGDMFSWCHQRRRTKTCTSMSSAEAEYVSLSMCYAQVLWMRTQLTDYGFHFDKMTMYCDSKASIAITCNPVQHFYTKHIDVRYHIIKEQVEKEMDGKLYDSNLTVLSALKTFLEEKKVRKKERSKERKEKGKIKKESENEKKEDRRKKRQNRIRIREKEEKNSKKNKKEKEERRKKEPRIRKEKKNREIGMNRRKKKEERIEEKGKEENRRKKEEQN